MVSATMIGGAEADQEEDQDDQHQHHTAQQIGLDGVGGELHQFAAIVIGMDLDVGRKMLRLSSLVLASTALSTFCVCSPRSIRMTPSTASSFFLNPNSPRRGAWPISTVANVLHANRARHYWRRQQCHRCLRCCAPGRVRARNRTVRPASRIRRRRSSCWRRELMICGTVR